MTLIETPIQHVAVLAMRASGKVVLRVAASSLIVIEPVESRR
jgi:hypothetical protein